MKRERERWREEGKKKLMGDRKKVKVVRVREKERDGEKRGRKIGDGRKREKEVERARKIET